MSARRRGLSIFAPADSELTLNFNFASDFATHKSTGLVLLAQKMNEDGTG